MARAQQPRSRIMGATPPEAHSQQPATTPEGTRHRRGRRSRLWRRRPVDV